MLGRNIIALSGTPMHTFFLDWRRKAGVVTLVMACLLFIGWGRSHLRLDVLQFSHHRQGDQFWSFRGSLGLRRWVGTELDPTVRLYESVAAKDADNLVEQHGSPFVDVAVTWRWESTGFYFGEGTHVRGLHSPMIIGAIPYWFPILTLTLLSASLILWKPRKRSPPN
jgi:hypothetical protein